MRELLAWLAEPEPATFPYESVVDSVRRVGKHFLSRDLIEALDKARAGAPPELATFLDTVLDKHDGRYDYLTYLALDLLPLPTPDMTVREARRRADRLVVALVTDAARFEQHPGDLLPDQRPDPATVAKRLRLADRAVVAATRRLGMTTGTTPSLELDRSMLPVATMHDEYLFIRVLQAFETTFALLAVVLRSTVDTLARSPDIATGLLRLAKDVLAESAPLFSLLATMRVTSFRTFRQHTEGASAIQSRNYKLVESLCRRPDPDRLDSPAFSSMPDLRDAPHATLDDALAAADLAPADLAEVTAAMTDFAAALTRWRQTHYRLALRMLGEKPGTGYTEGTPYLERVRAIPVFRAT
jgi:tryptophan 2,3-dioxygenase